MTKKAKLILGAAELLAKEELEIREVVLDKGAVVYVKQMTGKERNAFEETLLKKVMVKGVMSYEQNVSNFRAKLAVRCLCDVNGVVLLKSTDADTLGNHMSAARLEKIVNVAQEMNAITEEDKEELLKN